MIHQGNMHTSDLMLRIACFEYYTLHIESKRQSKQ